MDPWGLGGVCAQCAQTDRSRLPAPGAGEAQVQLPSTHRWLLRDFSAVHGRRWGTSLSDLGASQQWSHLLLFLFCSPSGLAGCKVQSHPQHCPHLSPQCRAGRSPAPLSGLIILLGGLNSRLRAVMVTSVVWDTERVETKNSGGQRHEGRWARRGPDSQLPGAPPHGVRTALTPPGNGGGTCRTVAARMFTWPSAPRV